MANAKEIRTQIKSIQNTQKITKALEMVAASKIRKAQLRMSASRPYAEKMRGVIGHLAQSNPAYKHPFMVDRKVNRIGYIVVTTDRGLCGGLNINLFKSVLQDMSDWQGKGAGIATTIIGNKGLPFFRRNGFDILSQASNLGDTPYLADLIGTVKVMLDAYRAGEIDRVVLGFNYFENTMTQRPTLNQLVPVSLPADDELTPHWDYIYEPESEELLDDVLVRYVESQVYQAVLENLASFQAAQMVAMKSASDNAGELIDDLQLEYNKTRQAAITKELAEIVGGAAAV